MARIAVGGFHHETNSFTPGLTDFAYFTVQRDRPPLIRGEEIFAWMPKAGYPLSAFLDQVAGQHEILPLVWTSGGAGATVSRDAFERIAGEMVGRLSLALPVDAVYLDLHGAMVTEEFEDGEGELLRRVRAAVGPAMPIVVSFDYHATLTPAILAHADAVAAFRTYPHVDMTATGARAAAVLAEMMETGEKPAKAFLQAPFLTAIAWQSTWTDPARTLYARLEEMAADVTAMSFNMGFPAADFADCGMSVLAYGKGAADAARAMMDVVEAAEPNFRGRVFTPEEGVAEALRLARDAVRPVVLSDTQDNPGAGANSDTTGMLRALLAGGAPGALGNLFDPASARAAHQAGVGASLRLSLGGRSQPGDTPFEGEFTVESLSDGVFVCPGPYYGGRMMQMGPSAGLRIGDVRIALTSAKAQMADREMFRHHGIHPEDEKIVVVKSSNHFRADFQPIAETVLVCAAPGPMAVNPATLPWRRLRPGLRLEPLGTPFKGETA